MTRVSPGVAMIEPVCRSPWTSASVLVITDISAPARRL
jgi:hypothetical protein